MVSKVLPDTWNPVRIRGAHPPSLNTIGHQVVFRLGGWAPRILTGFHVSADTLDTAKLPFLFAYKTVTSSGRLFHTVRLSLGRYVAVLTPRVLLLSV